MKIIKNFVERDKTIIEYCKGKSVLHLGCVGFTDCPVAQKIELAKESLHASISKVSKNCIGVDLDGDTVVELTEHGVFDNLVEGDVEKLTELELSGERFDLVVAGDIIEHLSNPGLMLEGMKGLMKPNGKLLVSTPNSFGVASWIRMILGKFREGEQHVLCFNPITLMQLLDRHGYELTSASSCYQARAEENYGVMFKFLRAILKRIPRLGGTLLYVCKLSDSR